MINDYSERHYSFEGCFNFRDIGGYLNQDGRRVKKGLYFRAGRFSGATRGFCVGHIGPEAALGGPIALLRNGDIIDIDAKRGTINVQLTKAQLASRKRKWKAKKSDFGSGTLWKYAQTVGPAYLGAPTHPGKKQRCRNL